MKRPRWLMLPAPVCLLVIIRTAQAAEEQMDLPDIYPQGSICLRSKDSMAMDDAMGICFGGIEVEVLERKPHISPLGKKVALCKVRTGGKEG